MSPSFRLGLTGFLSTAIGFGPARMGFGLFLPTFRDRFALSTAEAGMIAGLGFLAFLLSLPMAARLSERYGQRLPVAFGALLAAIGFVSVAGAMAPLQLALGVALAGTCAGFCWAPFNDAAERTLDPPQQPGVLSAVSTGTTTGVAAAGALYLAVASQLLDWRLAWSLFAGAAVLQALLAARLMPSRRIRSAHDDSFELISPAKAQLYAAAFVFGACNAVFLSFAADLVVATGGLGLARDRMAGAVIFLAYGVCGLVGLVTGRLEAWLGLSGLLTAIFAAFALSLFLIGLAPDLPAAVLMSSGLHGAGVMTVSAVLSFWSLRLFPGRGSRGFTLALIAVALGSVVGPPLAGTFASAIDLQSAFVTAAGAPLIVAAGFLLQGLHGRKEKAGGPGEPPARNMGLRRD